MCISLLGKSQQINYTGNMILSSAFSNSSIQVNDGNEHFARIYPTDYGRLTIDVGGLQYSLTAKKKYLVIANVKGDSIGWLKGRKIFFQGKSYKLSYPPSRDLRITGPDRVVSGRYQASKVLRGSFVLTIEANYLDKSLAGIMLYLLTQKVAIDNDSGSYWLLGLTYLLGNP